MNRRRFYDGEWRCEERIKEEKEVISKRVKTAIDKLYTGKTPGIDGIKTDRLEYGR